MNRLEKWLEGHLATVTPWSNVYGLARSIIALSTALTLLLNPADYFFRPMADLADHPPLCHVGTNWAFYCLGGDGYIALKTKAAGVLLLIIASGWRPRLTGVLHWYLVMSFQLTTLAVEGGDQVAAIITFLLIPITLMDTRRWHWQAPLDHGPAPTTKVLTRRLYGWMILGAIRVQVCLIYLHGAVGKAAKEPWQDGTSVFYWFRHPGFGSPEWLQWLTDPIVANGYLLTMLTWGAIFIELLLAGALFMKPFGRRIMFWIGILLHISFAAVFGLPSFSTVMFGALILYLCDPSSPFDFAAWSDALRARFTSKPATSNAHGT